MRLWLSLGVLPLLLGGGIASAQYDDNGPSERRLCAVYGTCPVTEPEPETPREPHPGDGSQQQTGEQPRKRKPPDPDKFKQTVKEGPKLFTPE